MSRDRGIWLRRLPKIDEVLSEFRDLYTVEANRTLLLECSREVIEELRQMILSEDIEQKKIEESLDIKNIVNSIKMRFDNEEKYNISPVINATGTILHTNLGRSKISEKARDHVVEILDSYSSLEYNILEGKRGSRHDIISPLIKKITGAEAAIAVNNNAAAVMLCLSALAKNKDVIVSRGELVEIGGSFRIPEIMKLSGSNLKEIGTTNKTHNYDYINAIDPENKGIILKVHTSNFKIMGFTEEVDIEELVQIGREHDLPVIYDLGSGLIYDLVEFGIFEHTVKEALAKGADLVLFSGDKLLGGPQAGIIVGKKIYIDEIKKHQLARVVRLDKMSLAALEATFRSYIDFETAKKEIPVLSMISMPIEEVKKKAYKLQKLLKDIEGFTFEVIEGQSQIGGGSTPYQFLDGYVITCSSQNITPSKMEKCLRLNSVPIVARIANDSIILDPRTIDEDEFVQIQKAFTRMGGNLNG